MYNRLDIEISDTCISWQNGYVKNAFGKDSFELTKDR